VDSPSCPLELPNQHDAAEKQQPEIEHSIKGEIIDERWFMGAPCITVFDN
jgi:hypothetical protein